jgi:hypothetical protein
MDGIGKLRKARHSHLEEMKRGLDDRIAMYHSKNEPHLTLTLLERDLQNVLVRLGSLRTTFSRRNRVPMLLSQDSRSTRLLGDLPATKIWPC